MTWASRWATRWERVHARLFPFLVVTAALLAWALRPSPGVQAAMLGVGVALFGLPHGAYDAAALRGRPRLGLGYVALALLTVGLFLLAPGLALAGFLILSAWHFGGEDAPGEPWPAVLAVGALPIAAPCAFRASEVAPLFGTVTASAPPPAALVRGIAVAVLILGAPFLLRRETPWTLLAALALPPLLAFLVTFLALHSWRHTVGLAAELDPASPVGGFAALGRVVLGPTVATVLLALPAWWLLGRTGLGAGEASVRTVFVGLAALTVPHVWLESKKM